MPITHHRSKRRRLLGLSALSLNCREATSFVTSPPWRQNLDSRLLQARDANQIVLPPSSTPELSVEESNFWRSVPKRQRRREEDVIPCESNLDVDGPLPFGAYRTYGNPAFEPKPTCLLTVALDFTPDIERQRIKGRNQPGGKGKNSSSHKQTAVDRLVEGVDVDAAVRNVQQLIDAGFISFQVAEDPNTMAISGDLLIQKWADENVFCKLRKDTPATVLRGCNFMTKIAVPSKDSAPFGSGSSIREAVGSSIRRTGADSLDTVQVQYCPDSPYHLDVLNVLSEMQEEGFIRSICSAGLPTTLMKDAKACNFHLDSNQLSCNLLDPQGYLDSLQTFSDTGTKILYGSPLAGGLLTDKYLKCERPPNILSVGELRHFQQSLSTLARRNGISGDLGDIWSSFHGSVLRTIGDIAFKHQVSVASVALRWSFHLDSLGSVVAGVRCGMDDQDVPFKRPKELRNVFRFDLDEEDMQRLWAVTGCDPEAWRSGGHRGDDGGTEGDLPPDIFANKKLWL